jgi:hypothetical protein
LGLTLQLTDYAETSTENYFRVFFFLNPLTSSAFLPVHVFYSSTVFVRCVGEPFVAESLIQRCILIRVGIKMKKSVMAAAVIVIVAIAAVAVGVYLATQGGGGGGGGIKNTYTVANATSLQLEADVTSQGVTITQKWAVKNLNTSQLMLRLDLLGGTAGNYSYILIASNQTVWSAENGTWTDVSSTFNNLWSIWGTHWTNLRNALANWSGTGDYTYTASTGESVRVYNINVNPSLADSLFQP